MVSQILANSSGDRISRVAERSQTLVLAAFDLGGIVQWPVQRLPGMTKSRAIIGGVVADRHDQVERLVAELIQMFAVL